MTWLYQALPLASSVTAADDQDYALTGEASTSAAGSCVPDRTVALSGSASTCGAGLMDLGDTGETIAGVAVTTASGTIAPLNNSVRLRSRKTGGASSATNLLTTQFSQTQSGTLLNNVSKLLGGSGITLSQQTFAETQRQRSVLLQGQSRTMGMTGMTAVGGAGSGLPAWVQIPTQTDELAFYATTFGAGSGKEAVWNVTQADRIPSVSQGGFGITTGVPVDVDLHGTSEGDDLWNFYQQYKRTGEQRYFDLATRWRNYYVSSRYEYNLQTGSAPGGDICGPPSIWHHCYLQGLCLWGKEQNDPVAIAQAEYLLGRMEPDALSKIPGTNSMTLSESRNYGRRLINACWVSMVNPIPRWITLRDHLIDCWVQSPGYRDTPHPTFPTIIGGNHFSSDSSQQAGWTATQGAQGLKWNHSFNMGIHNEALWLSYKLTGREDVRNMIIEMARFVLHYAWDPLHANAMCGSRWGYRPLTGPGAAPASLDGRSTPGFLHSGADEYSSATGQEGIQQPAPFPNIDLTNPNIPWEPNYEASHVNGLVYAYKLTGELPFLKRAREHWRKATQYANAVITGASNPKLSDTEVEHCMDTQRDDTPYMFAWNKGEAQYASYLFENGGNPTLETPAAWTPPYQVPTAAGQVVAIGGASVSAMTSAELITTGATYLGTVWPTNTWTSVGPNENNSTLILTGGDTSCTILPNYSIGGAIGTAGGGGHGGPPNWGSAIFDFTDGAWKRHWTGGSSTVNASNLWTDLQSGTRVHNVLYHSGDLVEKYDNTCGVTMCQNPAHWTPTAEEVGKVPLAADPDDQHWECGMDLNTGLGATHVYPDPANWGGLGYHSRRGYVLPSTRYTPDLPGTLAPTQSGLPVPGHIWKLSFELSPEDGGGPKGSIVCARHTYAGRAGYESTGTSYSHRFDNDTGIWHAYSTNSSAGIDGDVAGGAPWAMGQTTSGAYDPVGKRFFIISQNHFESATASGSRVNYINVTSPTWRNAAFGASAGVFGTTRRTENLMCDYDRRLLVMVTDENGTDGPRLRVANLASLAGHDNPNAILTTGTGGWKDVLTGNWPFTFTSGSYDSHFWVPFVYYPPNGKYYRFICRPPGGQPTGSARTAYWADPVACTHDKLQRITPPPIDAAAHAADPNYYVNSTNWTADEITLSHRMSRGNLTQAFQSVGHKWFEYVPSLELLAWLPLNNTGTDPTARRPVYLIKPF